jgi:Domain of unknown function (DUF4126)
VDLAEPFGELESTTGLLVLGTLLAVDVVGDKIPAVDHVLHAVGTVVAPASGAVLFVGQTGLETELPTAVAAIAGALLAGSVHAERALARPGSTVGTAGTATPVVSFAEDVASGLLVVVAFVVPVLAFVAVVALLVAGVWVARRVRRALGPGRRAPSRRAPR